MLVAPPRSCLPCVSRSSRLKRTVRPIISLDTDKRLGDKNQNNVPLNGTCGFCKQRRETPPGPNSLDFS
ncbi:hypothetical protein CQZ93_14620 [Ochrobactrum vermis]|nr:hypothetical protein CQZ93_14620 [Ochrobactrum vermis]